MNEHGYDDSPLHLTWCKNCQRAEERQRELFTDIARQRARKRLHRAADSIAAEPSYWRAIEQDLNDSDCLRIAELFVTGGDHESTQGHLEGAETHQP